MKRSLSILFIVLFSCIVRADIVSVAVPTLMLHGPSVDFNVGYSGKVEYSLNRLAYDSLFVTLAILNTETGAPVELSEVKGDVGLIRVGKPNGTEKHVIFFSSKNMVGGATYKAQITVEALESNAQVQTKGFLANLTKADKATLMGGGVDNMQGLGAGSGQWTLPNIFMADGPHGIRWGQATVFPTCAGEAATWDTAIAFRQGQAKAEEFRANGRNCELGPAMDLVYHPRCGRASEYYSEDPYLSGRMAAADVRGIQTRGCMATIKHYAANLIEYARGEMSSNMSERSLRELELYNWKQPVVAGNTWGIMGSYNKINHSWASSNKYLMTTILRDEWWYPSIVMTDWGAAFDNFDNGIKWGLDLDMPIPDTYVPASVAAQPDSILDMHAARFVYAHQRLGDLAPGYNRFAYGSLLTGPEHRAVAREAGSAGIVLAKNDKHLLPLPRTGAKIAVTGPFANHFRSGPGGSSSVTPKDSSTPLQGISELLKNSGAGASTIVADINDADYVVVFVGVTGETEGGDRPSLPVRPEEGENDAQAALAAKPNSTIVVFTGGSAASAGAWSNAPAVLIALYPGQEQGYCIADVLFGNVNPSGKLPSTFPKDSSQLPPFTLSPSNDLNLPSADSAHGYFRVNKLGQEPLFAFGHGLSYTSFSYANLKIFPDKIVPGDRVRIQATVTNTGTVAGKEVAQLYLSMPQNAGIPVRVQDLRGFAKISLNPGESKLVSFELTDEEMQVWDLNGGADYSGAGSWKVLPGVYGVRVGTSSQHDLQPTVSGSFTVQ
jgi:beta-glucosidase